MRKWAPLLAISLGAFILLVDITIVNVAIPQLATGLRASFAGLQWVVDAYALVLAALLLATGSLADALGRRRVYVTGLSVFGLASLGCALAPGAGWLIAARAVQGVGGAAMFATSAALLGAIYQGRDRGTAFGIWGAVNGAAAAIGPLLGGLLTERFGWQAIFLVNLPIAAVAIGLSLRVLPADHLQEPAEEPTGEPVRGMARVDVPGTVSFTLAAGALTYGLIRGGESSWTSASTLAGLAVAVAGLVAFVVVESRVARPMLDLRLLRLPSFSGLMGGALLLQAGSFGSLVLVSLWLQSLLGLSPIRGGLALMPLAVASFVTSALVGRFAQRGAPQVAIGAGAALIAVGMVALRIAVTADATSTALVAGLIVIGIGVGLATALVVSAAVGTVPPRRMGMAGGAVNTFRQLGLTLGIAVFGAVFVGRARSALAASGAVPDPHAAAAALSAGQAGALIGAAPAAARPALQRALQVAFADGLDTVFLWAAGASAIAAVVVALLVRRQPYQAGAGERAAEGRSAPDAP